MLLEAATVLGNGCGAEVQFRSCSGWLLAHFRLKPEGELIARVLNLSLQVLQAYIRKSRSTSDQVRLSCFLVVMTKSSGLKSGSPSEFYTDEMLRC